MSNETEPLTHDIDWDRVGTPRDIVAVLKAMGFHMPMTAEQARRAGIERFMREIKP